MSLAAKLPYDHPYAGGYPGIGSQPLPTDADALDYLARVKAADGAGVEVGVATAVSAFFRDLKGTPGLFNAIKASCIFCGARTITGALVPLAGDAPTSNGFVSGDYSRTDGITGDGTSYIDSGRAGNADPQNDSHAAVYITTQATVGSEYLSNRDTAVTAGYISFGTNLTDFLFRFKSTGFGTVSGMHTGFVGMSRSLASSFTARCSGSDNTISNTSGSVSSNSVIVFDRQNTSAATDATLAFYSIGTSVNLAALDAAVTNLITAIGSALNVPVDGGGSGTNVAPTVTLQPTNETVSTGGTATFTAAASGTPTPTVQWQLSTDGGSSWADIGGATSGSYTTPTLTAGDDGNQYRAVWTNSEGTATSNAATLSVTLAVLGSSLWILDAYPPIYHWSN